MRYCAWCETPKEDSDFYKSVKYKCRSCVASTNKKWWDSDYERNRSYRKRYRACVINHYSNGNNVCACCGESNIAFLTIDHINNDGSAEKKRTNDKRGSHQYQRLISLNFPDGYQVLCYNCNCGRDKQPDKVCPHKRPIASVRTSE